MKNSKSVINKTSAFRLKGSLLTFTVLQLLQPESELFAQQLAQLVTNTPNFFRNAPVIIDLEKLAHCQDIIDFGRMKTELVKHSIIPVGIRNGSEKQIQAALAAGLGVLNAKTERHQEPSAKGDKNITSKLITQPVRSGQQVYAQDSDLIVLASVSPGAEVLADGNIHIYGALRGRALAGVSGNTQAQIFCTKIEAELISIAGIYKLRDDIVLPEGITGAHIFLADNVLQINPI